MLRNNYSCHQSVPIYNMHNNINSNKICIYFIGELTISVFVNVTWSFHSILFPTIMLQWWGSDRAVQSQQYLPSSHCHLISPPFHGNPLILANFMARLQPCYGEKTLWYGCEGFQCLKTLTALEGRTANMMLKLRMMTVVLTAYLHKQCNSGTLSVCNALGGYCHTWAW